MKLVKAWFWSRAKLNENWAQTVFRVTGNLLRNLISLIIVLAVGVFAYSGISNIWLQNFDQRRLVEVTIEHREQSEKRKDDGTLLCSKDRPLIVKLSNKSRYAVSGFVIKLSARSRGRVENRLRYPHNEVVWRDIIPPNHFDAACYGNPTVRDEPALVYSGTAMRDSIKLIPVEDWMYDEVSTVEISAP